MNVAVVVFVKIAFCVNDLAGFLGGGCVVKVDEGVAVYLAFEDGKVIAQFAGVYGDFFSSSTFNRLAKVFASSSSSNACFSSKVCS